MHKGVFKQRWRRAVVLAMSCLAFGSPGVWAQSSRTHSVQVVPTKLSGAYPCAGLIWGANNRVLYGTTCFGGSSAGGTVFKLGVDGTSYSVLHSFTVRGAGGFGPNAPLVYGGDGAVYGTTPYGGGSGYGLVFRLNPESMAYTVLDSFTGRAGDGAYPSAGLTQGWWDGALYGTTYSGGLVGAGTVFKLNPDGTGYAVLHSFGVEDGALPRASLLCGREGVLYGTTFCGGSHNAGTVFKLNPDGTGYALLHSFLSDGGDGAYPFSALLQGRDGALYGTTSSGGSSNAGTIFKLNPDGSAYTRLHSFSRGPADGAYAYSALVQEDDGVLYGTTLKGGQDCAGTVFKLNPDGTEYALLHSFTRSGAEGAYPYSPLVRGWGRRFYGATLQGGEDNVGLVFKLDVDGTGYTVLQTFAAGVLRVPTPRLVSVAILPDQNCRLTLTGASNLVWRVEATASLAEPVTWEAVALVTNANGLVQCTDLSATNYPQRYYRAVWP